MNFGVGVGLLYSVNAAENIKFLITVLRECNAGLQVLARGQPKKRHYCLRILEVPFGVAHLKLVPLFLSTRKRGGQTRMSVILKLRRTGASEISIKRFSL